MKVLTKTREYSKFKKERSDEKKQNTTTVDDAKYPVKHTIRKIATTTTMAAAALLANTSSLQATFFSTATTRRKTFGSFRSSLVIETAEGQSPVENPPQSVTRRLILLRHAKSSWEDRSLKGTNSNSRCCYAEDFDQLNNVFINS